MEVWRKIRRYQEPSRAPLRARNEERSVNVHKRTGELCSLAERGLGGLVVSWLHLELTKIQSGGARLWGILLNLNWEDPHLIWIFEVGRHFWAGDLIWARLLLEAYIKTQKEETFWPSPACPCPIRVHSFTIISAYFFRTPADPEDQLRLPASATEQLLDSGTFCP